MIPLNTLGEDEFAQVVEESTFASLGRGERLVEQGDTDCFNIYLLKGSLSLLSNGREVDRISARETAARFPIAHQVPRKYAVRANTRVEIARVDNRLLGELLLRKGDTSYQVEEFDSRSQDDWMSQLLRLPAFQQVPAANMQSIMLRMEEVPVKKGDSVIREGDAGDFFYLIHRGRCQVAKRFLGDKPEPVAELGPGESFGEEALLSDKPRASSVSMLTDGVLVRLSKADFLQFVRQPATRVLRSPEAEAAVKEGAVWLDVRPPKAYERSHLPGSISLPLPVLRYQASSLAPEATYIVCCEDGHASYAAAFLLRERGFDARVLQGGLASLPAITGNQPVEQKTPAMDAAEALDAESLAATVIELRGVLSSSNASVEDLKEENLAYREEQVAMRDRMEALESQLAEDSKLRQALEAASSQVTELRARIALDAQAGEALRQELEGKLETAKATLETRLRQSEERAGRFEREERSLRAQLAERAGRLEILEREAARGRERQHQETERHDERVRGLEEALSQANSRAETLSADLAALSGRHRELREENTSLTESVAALRNEVEAAREQAAASEATLHEALEKAQRTLKAAEAARDEAQTEAELAAKRLNEQEQAHRAALAEQATAAKQRLEEARRKQEQESEALRKQLVELEQQHARSTSELSRQVEATEAARREAAVAAEAEQAEARSRLAEADGERTASTAEIARLESQLAAVNEEVAILRSTASELRQQLNVSPERLDEGEATALREELRLVREQAMSETTRLERETRELQEALSRADQRVESAREESALLTDALAAGEERFADLKAHLESAKQLAEEQKRALRSRGKKIAGLEKQVEQLQEAQQRASRRRETEVNELRGGLQQAETRARNLEKSLEQAEQSRGILEKEVTRLRIHFHNRETLPGAEEFPPGEPSKSHLGGLSAAAFVLVLAATAITLYLRPDSAPSTWLQKNLVARFQNTVDPSLEPPVIEERARDRIPPATTDRAVSPAPAEAPGISGDDSPETPVRRQVPTLKERLRNGLSGPEMVRVDGGVFLMGDARSLLALEEQPAHEVRLKGFYIGRQEVTFDDYRPFAAATGRRLPDDNGWGRGSRPVINVRWSDAAAYAEWLSRQTGQRYRLPSEAEWEYAARGGTQTTYWWGYAPERNRANCFDCGSEWDGRSTAPAGSFEPNPFGLHDTAGNVMEWVADCFHPNYKGAPADGTPWVETACNQRMIRGGAFNKPAVTMKNSKRLWNEEKARFSNLGFRLVRELE